MSSASASQETPPTVIHAVAAQVFKLWVASLIFVIFLYWNKATKSFYTNCNNFPSLSVNGQYASQGKLGVAVLGNLIKKDVITHNYDWG